VVTGVTCSPPTVAADDPAAIPPFASLVNALPPAVVTALEAPVVTAVMATVTLDVTGNGAGRLTRLGDAREHRERTAERETRNRESNQLVHGFLHSS
jgi:hypothetical protein